MRKTWEFVQHSELDAPTDAVWQRVVTPEGINDEMYPWMSMAVPRAVEVPSIDAFQVGERIGRAWLRLFRLVPFDYDDLQLTAIEPGSRFREESTMMSMRSWTHERTITATSSGRSHLVDEVTFTPRLPLRPCGALLRPALAAFFRHRHRRLAAHFAGRR